MYAIRSYYAEMQLAATELSQAPDAKPKLDFKAKFGPTPITVLGTCNPLVSPPHIDLAISVNGMEMVPLTPYTLSYLAYPVEKGRLYADVKFRTRITSYNVCYTKLLRGAHVLHAVGLIAPQRLLQLAHGVVRPGVPLDLEGEHHRRREGGAPRNNFV